MAIQYRLPTSDVVKQWIASSGSPAYPMVDDPVGSPDDDTTYIYKQDSIGANIFGFTDFDITSSTITKVSLFHRSRQVNPAVVDLRSRLQVNGVNYDGTQNSMTDSYAEYTDDWLTNPNTSLDWVEADVEGVGSNPIEAFRHDAINISAGEEVRMTQAYISVTYTVAAAGRIVKLAGDYNGFAGNSGGMVG